ncbi:MAG: Ig-like domain-containing protein, partial [Verrucomicrobia bacterium]|nr:Ig-like domain-containing protein [Verrucomicrobiota bacterium]
GEWHHVVVGWFPNHEGLPTGLPLWIDKVAVDGPIASGNTFLDPAAMDDARLWIGDATSEAAMDELVMRAAPTTEEKETPLMLVYRDSFRTAPYTAIAINHEACFVHSDKRVVEGAQKQFGLLAELGGRFEPVTNFDVRYGQWTDFDAKPFIAWSTSDETVATVDANGMVQGHAVGRCTLTAEFRGMKATYDVRVIPVDQPDLVLMCVSRLPRYHWEDLKNRPAPGDAITFVARVANYGYRPVPKGAVVQIEYVPDSNANFVLDRSERPMKVERKTIDRELAPLDEVEVEFEWTYTDAPVWTRVTVDPRNRISEICEANNERTELSNARPVHFGYDPAVLAKCYDERVINHVGSFCYYDWFNGQKARLDHLVREAVYDEITPEGIQDAFRTDQFTRLALGETRWQDEEWETECPYYDGGFPVNEPVNFMAIDSAIIHEFGHTILALPDLYGHPCLARNVFLTDENGEPYAGGPLLPEVTKWGNIMASPGEGQVECYTGYSPLMVYCHQWLHPVHAGQVQYYRGLRGPRFWGVHGLLIPTSRHELLVLDANDEPLKGAAVYAYHTTHMDAEDSSAKFFADRPKYVGHTNAEGRYEFPGQTDEGWDSPETDEADGAIDAWNPFGLKTKDTAFTPNCFGAEGMMLLKIVSGGQTEFHWLTQTMMNEEFFKGAKNWGVYTIRTSLKPRSGRDKTPLVQREVPEAIRTTNFKPVAKIDIESAVPDAQPEITVKAGESIRIDGSASSDPEGQPLVYRWHAQWPFEREYSFSDEPAYEGKAPDRPGETQILFYVIDGIRASDTIRVKVKVIAANDGAAGSASAE